MDFTVSLENLQEVSPKYVQGNKRYGRRSRPFQLEDFEELIETDVQTDTENLNSSPSAQPPEKVQPEPERVHRKPPQFPRKSVKPVKKKVSWYM